MNVPKLRFGEFFANKWNNKQLVNICDMRAGKFVRASEINGDFDEGLYPCYGGNGLRGFTKSFTHEGKHSLIGRQGALCGNVTLAINKFHATEHAVVVSASEGVSTDWLFYALGRLNLNQYATGQAQPGLSVENLEKVELSISDSEKEQQKIADFLSAVDEKITALTAQKTALTQYKQGMMQRIFAQTLRFKDDNGADYPEWEEMRLGDLLDYEQPTKYLVSSTDYQDDYPIPVLTAGKTFILGYTDEQGGIFTNLPVIIFDDFTTANKFVNFPFKAKSSAMKMLKNDPTNSNLRFIYETMQLLDFATGDEHKRYWISEYQEQFIFVPCLEEQTKIAQFLTELDNKINAVDAQIQSAQQWKQGLLQQMFV